MSDKATAEFEEYWATRNNYKGFKSEGEAAWLAAKEKYEPRWVPVSERMPDSGVTILALYVNHSGNIRRVRATYVRPFTLSQESDSDFGEYNEDHGEYFCPEGWYEEIDNWDEYSYVQITDGAVTHWMPSLPHPAPKEKNDG